MKIELKYILPYVALIVGLGMSWGMFSERLDAVEVKADRIANMQTDIAIIKEKIMWIEAYLVRSQ
jgi:hypothetical protein|tara:strand:+ start:1777 stop:1971 length:195 start_codon:yes stop_codon:yes gene_type:complete